MCGVSRSVKCHITAVRCFSETLVKLHTTHIDCEDNIFSLFFNFSRRRRRLLCPNDYFRLFAMTLLLWPDMMLPESTTVVFNMLLLFTIFRMFLFLVVALRSLDEDEEEAENVEKKKVSNFVIVKCEEDLTSENKMLMESI